MDKRQCQNCGAYYDAEKGGCPYCGPNGHNRTVFIPRGESTAPTRQYNAYNNDNNGPVYNQQPSYNTQRPVTYAPQKPSSKKGLKGFLITLLIMAIIAGGILCYIKFGPKPNIYVGRESDTYLVNWKADKNVANYNVYIDGEYVGQTKQNQYEITTHLVDDAYYKIVIKAVDTIGDETEVYTLNYNYQALTKEDFARKPGYFIMGKQYDYVIDSVQEYEAFVWYNILYRNTTARCYSNTDQITRYNADSQTRSAINNYPEYDALNGASRFAVCEDKVIELVNFRYYLPKDFTKATADVSVGQDGYHFWNYVQNHDQYTKNTNFNQDYYTASDAGEDRHFEIDNQGRIEVVVNNTEQLFWAVQYGARPVFKDETSVAAICYNNAKTILKQINSDSLTDYQKIFNIYTYLCSRVTYDHVLLDYMSVKNDFSVNTFGHFNVFYMESILYDLDNQISVCDGIAKTFTLLCRIEGIAASKINGIANIGAGSSGAHAWNRVKLDNNWYIVDCTWGVASYIDTSTYYEAFTYAYFLVSEEEIEDTHRAEYQINSENTISYNFYQNHTVSTNTGSGNLTIDLYIENDADLTNLLKYMYYSNENFLNVKFDHDFLDSMCPDGSYDGYNYFENDQWVADQSAVSAYIKDPINIGIYTYQIASWLDYDMCFLIIGMGSNGSL